MRTVAARKSTKLVEQREVFNGESPRANSGQTCPKSTRASDWNARPSTAVASSQFNLYMVELSEQMVLQLCTLLRCPPASRSTQQDIE